MPTVYITTPPEAADDIAEALVEGRHAACVNVVDCHSVYRWEGDVVHDDEAILLAKTTDDAYDDLVALVQERHPYDVPCIERFDEADVDADFGDWVRTSVES
ncbi:divalent-cation tolerance protein CutA [Halobacterium bonnevillei]|uniref:Divalent cation tolerance protein CutA n=1 Tax=Halobacterium bonnevillei TaxID=2692200 RepID=A0A6B0SGV5_9EURY|nr:divalent-cation tolerance protein CutA [Halobacterium bonnevillei]MXR20237.1 divalent cation tolerance protein CutA [Halobacterium bonnevillei]